MIPNYFQNTLKRPCHGRYLSSCPAPSPIPMISLSSAADGGVVSGIRRRPGRGKSLYHSPSTPFTLSLGLRTNMPTASSRILRLPSIFCVWLSVCWLSNAWNSALTALRAHLDPWICEAQMLTLSCWLQAVFHISINSAQQLA